MLLYVLTLIWKPCMDFWRSSIFRRVWAVPSIIVFVSFRTFVRLSFIFSLLAVVVVSWGSSDRDFLHSWCLRFSFHCMYRDNASASTAARLIKNVRAPLICSFQESSELAHQKITSRQCINDSDFVFPPPWNHFCLRPPLTTALWLVRLQS